MADAGNVILAADRTVVTDRAYEMEQWVEPIAPLAEAAAGLGIVAIEIDPDGVVRRSSADVGGRPSLALAVAQRVATVQPVTPPGAERLIRFAGAPRQGIITVSYYQALESGLLPAGFFRDKIVFVGRSLSAAAALEAPDHFRTPVAVRTPGVEIHASVTDNLLRNRPVADPFGTYGRLVGLCVVLAILATPLFYLLSPAMGLVLFLGVIAALTGAAYGALTSATTRLPIATPTVAIAGVYLSATAYRVALGQRERRLIRRAFQHYVAPAIVEQMLADPSKLRLGGEAFDLTVLFTDLEGFTSIAERLTPHEIQDRLTTYFKAMMEVLLVERATLDKFIGDAIMVYFGCPLPDPRHPAQACRGALAMQRRLAELNQQWRADGSPELRMRVGVNSGTAVAGNMGTDTIFNFTIIGDCVNLASRLEGVNKEYGSLILVGEDTWSRLDGRFDGREIDWIRVKGKAEKVAIYELVAEAGRCTEVERAAMAAFSEGLSRYRSQRWAEASVQFERALQIRPGDGPSRAFIQRCQYYSATPPPAPWDGVHVMRTK